MTVERRGELIAEVSDLVVSLMVRFREILKAVPEEESK